MTVPFRVGEDPLDALKAMKAQHNAPDPLDELKALRPSPKVTSAIPVNIPSAKADVTSALPRNREDVSGDFEATVPAVLGNIANLTQGIPGVEALQAGARSVVRRQPYAQALSDIRGQTENIPTPIKMAERVVGTIPLLPLLPANPIAGGAILGGVDQALSATPRPLLNRGLRTLGGAAVGGAAGAVMQGASSLAQRTGLTDVIGKGLRKIGNMVPAAGDVGEAIGTKGAANQLLSDRQAILDQLSTSDKSAAQTMADHIDQYKTEASKLYAAARGDRQAIDDPRVAALLDDPTIQHAYEWGKANYLARGNELPTRSVVAPGAEMQEGVGRVAARARTEGGRLASLTRASDDELASEYKTLVDANAQENTAQTVTGMRPTDYSDGPHVGAKTGAMRASGRVAARNKSVAKVVEEMQRRGIDPGDAYQTADASSFEFGANVPATTLAHGAESTVELPTPEVLALTKRGLGQIAKGYASDNAVTREQAVTMLPKLDELRAALHDASPAWKEADAYYANAKNFETAFQKAYGMQSKSSAAGLDPSKLKTPDALQSFAEQKAGTPVGMARASGVQAGTSARLSEAVKSAPLGENIGQTLQGAHGVFQPSENAARVRGMAFGRPEDAATFNELIAKFTGTPPKTGPQTVSLFKLRQALKSGNPLATPAGIRLRSQLSSQLADPSQAAAIREALARAGRGKGLTDLLTKLGLSTANSPFSNP